MYKVFFNHNVLFLSKNYPQHITLHLHYKCVNLNGLKGFLFDTLLQHQNKNVFIELKDTRLGWECFQSLFTIKEAAGGLVYNNNNEWLFIKRRGLWDIPKGHIEKKEKRKKAAIREVAEECGIKKLKIKDKLTTTYHTYWLNEKPVLKPTHWYLMKNKTNEEPNPQVEEEITEARWMKKEEVPLVFENTFPSIVDVVNAALGS